ncbi:uncharacterized protein LOC128671418 [Plodia interpunctella]|uniref:uncharacterized protein LOC128671418 n=1 Tax=Plodia interpunctella TaxID=58824 RepID=UPI002367AB8C|nr:uncharacterized protein LOC128671418 [Plodia interpunctella]
MSTRLKSLYVVYIILLLCRDSVVAEEPVNFKITDTLLICSSWLASVITKVCDNTYKIVKRDTSVLMEKMAPKSVQEQKTKLLSLEKERWRRVRRQIATECCDNPCTVATIIMYCPNDSRVIRENPDLFEVEDCDFTLIIPKPLYRPGFTLNLHKILIVYLHHFGKHRLMKIVVIWSLTFLVLIVDVKAEDKVTLCGTELAKARVLLCYGADYVMKRRIPSLYDMERELERRLWRHYQGAGVRWERNKRGLVDECCLKPCSTDVILSYC